MLIAVLIVLTFGGLAALIAGHIAERAVKRHVEQALRDLAVAAGTDLHAFVQPTRPDTSWDTVEHLLGRTVEEP